MVRIENIQFVIMDIEGTISDIRFVRDVLFPYSARELRNFVSEKRVNPTVQECLKQTGAADAEGAIQQLLKWIEDDVKHPALKTLQGLIWEKGYRDGAFRSPLYSDVLQCWEKWRAQGLRLGIYSSGSLQAQSLFFTYTEHGDVRAFLEAQFDLDVGGKKEKASYEHIADKLNISPDQIVFLSDIVAELDAATQAGFKTVHVVRPGTKSENWPNEVRSFEELELRRPHEHYDPH